MNRNLEIEDIRAELRSMILEVNPENFEILALKIFRFQAAFNPVYRNFLENLNCRIEDINRLEDIPCLPISLFKKHRIVTGTTEGTYRIFESSGTTGTDTSRHYVRDAELYKQISRQIFESHYGRLDSMQILALLPSYLERDNSSLVFMVSHFIKLAAPGFSGFFLNNFDDLNSRLIELGKQSAPPKTLLIGVTFALLDWAEKFGEIVKSSTPVEHLTVMETGGMKGRRKEMLRSEVHEVLQTRLGVTDIHSEYGMTEMISQVYSPGKGIFYPKNTVRVLIRDITDPRAGQPIGKTGGVNVIDLGNLDSCAFLETSDLGRILDRQGAFEIMGRTSHADLRGCNLMYV